MSMTPEEEFNQEVWQVLQKIRKAELATVGRHIEYKFPQFVGVGIIPKEKQKKILYKLQEWDALKIRENPWEPPESTPDTFYLNLIQPKFNETYEKFQKACDLTSYLNDFQEKALSNEEKPKFSQVYISDKATQKGVEKKWDVLQAIWSVYESNSRPESIFVPVARLTIKDRDVELIDGIIEGLKKEGGFQKWNRKDRHYDIQFINHELLPKVYQEVGDTYRKLVSEHRKQQETSLLQSSNRTENIKKQVECCGLFYSFQTNQLIYTGGEKDISPETREMKFFLTLYRNKGQTVDYKTIAKEANLQSYKDMSDNGEIAHEDLQNKDFSEDASLLRRDFRKIVLSLGMSDAKFKKMIKTIKKKGYQLVCQ